MRGEQRENRRGDGSNKVSVEERGKEEREKEARVEEMKRGGKKGNKMELK